MGTLIVFMAIGVLPCPTPAKAQTVAPGASCKEWISANPNFVTTDPTYLKLCSLTEDAQAEFMRLLEGASYECEGCPPVQTGFVAPAPGPAIRALINQVPRVQDAFSTAGKGAGNAAANLSWRWLSPSGVAGAARTPNANATLRTGDRVGTWKPSNGAVEGRLLITGVSVGGIVDGRRQISVSFKGDHMAQTANTKIYGGWGVHCLAEGSLAATNVIRSVLGTSSTTPHASTIDINERTQCRMASFDAYGSGNYSVPRVFGPTLPPESLPAGPQHQIGNNAYNLATVDAPQPLTADPPAGDTVMPPHESRILLDETRALPEYVPPRTAPDGTDQKQWEEHQKRRGVLAPVHGAPTGEPQVNPDGSLTTRFADGTQLTTWPDLTEVVKRPDGTEQWQYPGGPAREVNPDTGSETITYPDGTQVVTNPGEAPVWSRPPAPGAAPEPIPTPPAEQYPPPPSGNYTAPPVQEGTAGCPAARKFTFDLPTMKLADVFPFSLIVRAWLWLEALSAPPVAPSFEIPMFGRVTVPPAWDAIMGGIRGAILLICGIGMSFWFYRYISGRGSE